MYAPDELTRREVEVLRLVAEGLRNKQIAKRLVISEPNVENHLHSIYQKLDVATRTAAAMCALKMGLLGSRGNPS